MTSHRAVRGLSAAAAIALVSTLTAPVAFAAPAGSAAAKTARAEDFNGDGYRDVAVAATGGTVGTRGGAGYVTVLYGAKDGAGKGRKQRIHRDSPGIPGAPAVSESFGSSLTSADLDRDGFTDLIVGARGTRSYSGSLTVVWGGRGGLAGGARLYQGATSGIEIGRHTAAGDFDGDGDADVVSAEDGRSLIVLNGPFSREGQYLGGPLRVGDGEEAKITDLAAGDINRDGRVDLAATRHFFPDDDSFHTVYWKGTSTGPAPAKQITHGPGTRLQGSNLDIGDINKDGYGDLVVGRPHDGTASDPAAATGGMITYVPGSASGPVGTRVRVFNQDSPGVPGSAEGAGVSDHGDQFGTGVTIGDIDGDGYRDVAVGVPFETIGPKGRQYAGTVVTLRGTRNGPTGDGARLFSQDTAGVPGTTERWDLFGTALNLADTDGDRRGELIVGALAENSGEGAFWVLRGTSAGTTGRGAAAFSPRAFGGNPATANLGGVIND
ncbi:FG-GAP and VCBS repeat-containing protein [Streptomyces sp. NPDC020141]|uniref:FG-GAP and VCBS repeat-containing protein n=1 Tax=Streptomyces sp. NPDC020141 TaxID=3365065 RepID=UPI00378791CC